MKKLRVGIIFLLVCFLVSCNRAKVYEYNHDNLDKFNQLLENVGNGKTKAYDLRLEEDCRFGRIPKFYCMRTVNSDGVVKSLDSIFADLLLTTNHNKGYFIILIDEDGSDCKYLGKLLYDEGYYNVHYYLEGYASYASLMGENFVPDSGDCDC